MERTFFFLGFCPPSIRAVWWGEMQFGRGKAKLFLREEKDLLCLGSFFKTAGIWYPPRRRVREECAADFSESWLLACVEQRFMAESNPEEVRVGFLKIVHSQLKKEVKLETIIGRQYITSI